MEYEVEFKNGRIWSGKGKEYYENDKIKYEGEYSNGKWNGKGKAYYDNGNYEGDFVNGYREGNGKYIWEDGDYYIGQWKGGKRHGKGIMYYANGNIKYEGDWIDGKKNDNKI